jgi:hypothetical protein
VLPAGENLKAFQAPGAQVYERLEIRNEFARLDCAMKFLLEQSHNGPKAVQKNKIHTFPSKSLWAVEVPGDTTFRQDGLGDGWRTKVIEAWRT